ncbi:MAG: tetratricopeptide repeat protein [Sphingomonas sp.]
MPSAQAGLAAAELGQALQQAMTLARSGRSDAAEAMLNRILDRLPGQPDALQLLGMIARQSGRQQDAVALFRRSLAANPAQPHVLNNLGNSLSDLGRHDEAVAAYRDAMRLQPGYADAAVNLGLALIASGDRPGAAAVLGPLLHRDPRNARAWASLGQALDGDEAIGALRQSLALRPDHVPTRHNLAVALRLAGRAAEALPLFERCRAADPATPEIAYNHGHCLQDLGRIDDAVTAYGATIALRPTDRAAHASLNRLLWQHGRTHVWLASYRAALSRHSGDQGLLADYGASLLLAGHADQAAALLAPHVDGAGAELRYQHGRALWSLGKADAALAAFRSALPFAPAAREAARIGIILDRPTDALPLLDDLLAADPADQQALAIQGLAWRFTEDPRETWLNDVSRFVSEAVLTPGDGDVAGFNARLDAALTPLHRATQSPLDQTLRGGTQTSDDLFALPLPEVAAVRAMIEARLHAWIAELPEDGNHPFLRRKSTGFAFSGSWSVRLRSAGFHENHIHPEGWISAVYYVALPDAVAQDEQGWLKFGESGLRLGHRERIARIVRPEVGKLVLFPSYFYHGTVPFEDAGHRTTIAFDVVPA